MNERRKEACTICLFQFIIYFENTNFISIEMIFFLFFFIVFSLLSSDHYCCSIKDHVVRSICHINNKRWLCIRCTGIGTFDSTIFNPEMSQYRYAGYRHSSVRISYRGVSNIKSITDGVLAYQYCVFSIPLLKS